MFSRITRTFKSLEDAIDFCRSVGCGFEISYPKKKYFQPKNYANNFKWKGNPTAGEEDIV